MPNLKPFDYLKLALILAAVAGAFVWLESKESAYKSPYKILMFRGREDSFSERTFKIIQIADIHLGEAEYTDWGPQQDVNTFRALDQIIPMEQPDLIVLSGDQLTANDMDQNATVYYYQLCQFLSQYNIPWAAIFGNHDDMPREYTDPDGNKVYTNQTKTSRSVLYEVDHSFAPLSLTQKGPSNLFGTSNYMLNVYLHDDDDGDASEVALQLLFLDSGGGSLPKQLEANQVQWFQSQRQRQRYSSNDIPMAAFQHIPTTEFTYVNDGTCQGLQEDGVDAIQRDPGIVNALHKDDNTHFLAVGHNHGNDYCCAYNNNTNGKMHVCFGRHSGYGGYGSWDRGARVYEFQTSSSAETMIWSSWVRMESGDIQDEYSPFAAEASDVDGDDNADEDEDE